MVDQLSSFADEVTRVAKEVGTDGKLGGQAEVEGVSGTWRGLTENVNFLASNLTDQVRNIAQVTTAVADGDLSQKITVDVKGEMLELKNTVNLMVDQLSSFADEVTRVAKEVGTEGKLGGQAEVEGVSGTWRGLTENVNFLASNLTTQVRAIAEVSTAVTQGDLTREIAVEAQGEVAELKDNINQMIGNLKETTEKNAEQNWLKTELARISGLMQGQRDLRSVSRLIMSEVTPGVSAQHGAFFMSETGDGDDPLMRLIATYGYKERKQVANRFALGEGLVGQAALERKPIVITQAPDDYIKISSGLGEAAPTNIVVLPVVFEDQVLAVIELASFRPFSETNQSFLEQLTETIGVVLNTIVANMRTEELLEQSQSLAQELQSQQEELQSQRDELKGSNAELEQQTQSLKASEEELQAQREELQQSNEKLGVKASLLAAQNRDIEIKNQEIETASGALEEKAEQLSLSSKYKSEFLANMSHELRTPLNSLLILAKLLSDNPQDNLTPKQVEFASTIHNSGSDLLNLINDILDLSKVEAGKMDVHLSPVELAEMGEQVERAFGPVAEHKGLALEIDIEAGTPATLYTDPQRLQQVLKNLLSNALKFTETGRVTLRVASVPAGRGFATQALRSADEVIAMSVVDTGIGMSTDKLRLVFEAFQQADGTTSRKYGGTGLGLSISREIARLLEGEIRVESTEGEGSSFTFYLPRTYADPAPRDPQPGPEASSHGPVDAKETEAPQASSPVSGHDDRANIEPGDRVLLIIQDGAEGARAELEIGRREGFKGILAIGGPEGIALAHEFRPDAILLDRELSGGEDLATLTQLKNSVQTRHIPVFVVSATEERRDALKLGAASFLQKPVGPRELSAALAGAKALVEQQLGRVLLVEDDETERDSVRELISSGDDVEVVAVGSSEEALAALAETHFACMILDLKLPDMTGFALLEELHLDERLRDLPVIVHTGMELTPAEEAKLRRYAETIVVKDASSPERLLDQTVLFLHRPASRLSVGEQRTLEQLHHADAALHGHKVLIVDDDVRNVFALTSVLESLGIKTIFAENGRAGLEILDLNPDVDLVLMDVMMPEMDGYETTRAVRAMPQHRDLPIISLTAKAMAGDREKSFESGASDYVTKPLDPDRLVSLMHVWLGD
jgi:signal transduction histidine kinase/CheY-like chemotaxis protein/HAMP domain-containing protein